jgi:hypothetical protein
MVMFPGFSGVGLLDDQPSSNSWRNAVPVAQVADDLQISAQVIYTWRQQLVGAARSRA